MDDNCVLCHGGTESHTLECQFPAAVRGQVWRKCGGSWFPLNLGEEITKCLAFSPKSSLPVIGLKLGLAASIYHLWRERNNCIFQSMGSNSDMVFRRVADDIRACLCSWKAVKASAETVKLLLVFLLPSLLSVCNFLFLGLACLSWL